MSDPHWRAQPHRRRNALTGEWVLVSPHRTQRPWQGAVEKSEPDKLPRYDPDCYLCPGNERAGGARNPQYDETFVFTNDFAALLPGPRPVAHFEHPLLDARSETGTCRVVCFSPRHDISIAAMDGAAVRTVVDTLTDEFVALGAGEDITWVQIFENHGAMMGASNPHPHCQIWGEATLPNEAEKETRAQRAYMDAHGACLLCSYVELEVQRRERLVYANEAFATIVPFWAVWPFETLLVSRQHRADLASLTSAERDALADAMQTTVRRYDRLFDASFPYTMGFHQRPVDRSVHGEWHLHAHYYPPLLRSATIRKFMVGYEMLSQPQRDITAEQAAERLREVAD
ncbi:MAG: UDP-glucose--hexose-1-phosphate uridylyltransferase [Vulcanimicrobiaceae bacterium]